MVSDVRPLSLSLATVSFFRHCRLLIADFCAGGGDNDLSPIGTLKDIIVLNGYNETSLPYSALEYYEGVSCCSCHRLSQNWFLLQRCIAAHNSFFIFFIG